MMLVVARLDVLRGQGGPIVESDRPEAQLERVGQAIGRNIPALGQIAHHLRVVFRIELQQQAVVRRGWVDIAKVVSRCAVERRWLGAHHERQLAATSRLCGRFRVGGWAPEADGDSAGSPAGELAAAGFAGSVGFASVLGGPRRRTGGENQSRRHDNE